jgi:hypothetical protein
VSESRPRAALPPAATILKEQCRCGHGVDHFWIRPQKQWGGWAWLGIMGGVRMAPRRVDYKCGRCGDILASITDAEALKRMR